jgi:hypothetical protein
MSQVVGLFERKIMVELAAAAALCRQADPDGHLQPHVVSHIGYLGTSSDEFIAGCRMSVGLDRS